MSSAAARSAPARVHAATGSAAAVRGYDRLMDDASFWRELGQQLRVDSIRASDAAGSGHPTSSMSAADLVAVLLAKHLHYDFGRPDDPRNDHLIFSKGHASPLYYSALKAAGAIADEELLTFRKLGSRLEGHPTPVLPWVDVATGSLGQGLPIGVGVALAGKRLEQIPYRVWVLCGDSEMAEGSMWEAFEHAAHEQLDNLTAIIDVNRLGQTRETMHGWDLDSYAGRARAFGWHAIEIDGHDVEEIDGAYAEACHTQGRPTVIVARTKKGKGAREVEDQEGKHGKPLSDPQKAIAGARQASASLQVEVPKPAGDGRAAAVRPRPRRGLAAVRGSATRSPPAAPTARRSPRSAPSGAMSSRSTARSSNSTYSEIFAKAHPDASSRCTSPSSRWWPPRSACRCAAATVRLDLRGLPHPRVRLRPHGRDQPGRTCAWPARTPASRSARTARRRWRSRTWPRSAPCTARASCSIRPTANQTAQLVALMADHRRASSTCARTAARRPTIYGPDEPVRDRRLARRCARPTTTRSRSSAPASRCTRR